MSFILGQQHCSSLLNWKHRGQCRINRVAQQSKRNTNICSQVSNQLELCLMPASCLARVASCSYLLSCLSWASSCASAKLRRRATGHAAVAQGIPLIQKDEAPDHAKILLFGLLQHCCNVSSVAAGCQQQASHICMTDVSSCIGATAHGPQVSTSQT